MCSSDHHRHLHFEGSRLQVSNHRDPPRPVLDGLHQLTCSSEIDHSMFVLNVDLWSEDGKSEVNLVRHSSASPAIGTVPPPSYAPLVHEDAYRPLSGPTQLPPPGKHLRRRLWQQLALTGIQFPEIINRAYHHITRILPAAPLSLRIRNYKMAHPNRAILSTANPFPRQPTAADSINQPTPRPRTGINIGHRMDIKAGLRPYSLQCT